jgi:hypothetical protein
MVGMVFGTRHNICGQQVHFAMNGDELIIRTRERETVYELIPPHKLQHDFPLTFSTNYFHWLDIASSNVAMQWRPFRSPWNPNSAVWRMLKDEQPSPYLTDGKRNLIDIQSPIFTAVSIILSPIEHAANIEIIYNQDTSLTEVRLPRLNLDFKLQRDGSLKSKQFRGMVVDKNQSFGTMSGLTTKLVLQGLSGTARLVIIPDGRVNFIRDGNHSQVSINTGNATRLKYHHYHIDSQLGRLIDNGSLLSRIYKLYLHALTSHCLPDLLTGRTGTEEALHGLAMASTQSFLELGDKERDILELITELTPVSPSLYTLPAILKAPFSLL